MAHRQFDNLARQNTRTHTPAKVTPFFFSSTHSAQHCK